MFSEIKNTPINRFLLYLLATIMILAIKEINKNKFDNDEKPD